MIKRNFNKSMLALVAISAVGCGTQAFKDRNPQLSDLKIDSSEIHVQVPMPPPKPERAAYRAEAASLWDQSTSGFFADQRATTIGDILTVNIEIDDKASFSNVSNTERGGGSSIGKPTLFGYENKLDEILPGISTEEFPTGNIADISSTTKTNGSGKIERDETIELIPGSSFSLMRKVGHLPCVEQPQEYAALLSTFLQDIGHHG